MRVISRARTDTPGSNTWRSTSQAVARSNRTLGCSALSQARVQPAHKRERDAGITELAVPIDAPYFGCMFPGGVGSCAILGQTGHVADAELGSNRRDNGRRDVGWLGQERAQEPSGGQLQREPELVLCTAPHFDQLKVGGARREEVDDLVVEGRPES